jgi:predicted sulfurtransferase
MLSFYSFPVAGIADPDEFATTLRKLYKPFQALGRVYVAEEGVNAQMAVPTSVLPHFVDCCNTLPHDVGTYLRDNGGINVDPVPLTREEFAVTGVPAAAGQPAAPFTNLHIRVRLQVVTDGLNKAYNWQKAGMCLSAALVPSPIKTDRFSSFSR